MKIIRVIKSPKKYALVIQECLKNKWKVIVHKGNKVHCVICDWKGKSFFGGKCPKCGSLPRTRLIPYAINYFRLVKPNLKILHVAPNENELNYLKKKFNPITQYDRLNIRPIKHINVVRDLTSTGLPSNSYDFQIIWHVLEHIPEDQKAIEELYRLLKPGGKLLVSVPIYPKGNKHTFEDKSIPYKDFHSVHGHYDHCRSCGLDYYKRFEEVGFHTDTLMVKNLSEDDIEYYGLSSDHTVWCFEK